jgi:multiple sugar transport system substrate-binding protein
MKLPILSSAMVLAVTATALLATSSLAKADDLSMWVRASGAGAAQHMIDLWNTTHADKKIRVCRHLSHVSAQAR